MKLFSFSCYGNNPRYTKGTIKQVELVNYFFPDFKIRIYTDNKKQFEHLNVQVVEMKDDYYLFWRFYPLFEDENNIVLVRDVDSRITIREKLAIDEWLNSDKKFHNIKDHESHYEFPIMGAMFGYKGKLPNQIKMIMEEIQKHHQYLLDQYFLGEFVYPIVRHEEMIHHMHNGWFGETRKRLKNKNSFVGNGYDENDNPIYDVKDVILFDKGELI